MISGVSGACIDIGYGPDELNITVVAGEGVCSVYASRSSAISQRVLRGLSPLAINFRPHLFTPYDHQDNRMPGLISSAILAKPHSMLRIKLFYSSSPQMSQQTVASSTQSLPASRNQTDPLTSYLACAPRCPASFVKDLTMKHFLPEEPVSRPWSSRRTQNVALRLHCHRRFQHHRHAAQVR